MHHAEQPSLPRVGDGGVWRELSASGYADVARDADARVDVVGRLLVEDEQVDSGVVPDLGQLGDFVRTAAKSGSPEEVLDAVVSSRHDVAVTKAQQGPFPIGIGPDPRGISAADTLLQ